jgi:small subunit ribosomal protein S17
MPKKVLVGKVVSNKMDKTAVVAVEISFPHSKYEKQIIETRKFKAHDEENKCQMGDVVRIEECRPISRDKTWTLLEILSHDVAVTPSTATATASAAGEGTK